MAMSCRPDLLIFDEPTTALDVTTQIEVLAAIKEVVRQSHTAAIYISHDLAVVAQMADRIMVLRYGELPGPNGGKQVQHQADMFLYTDSIGAAIAAKVVGAAAPKMAEQCVTQMQMFFSGLAWYVHRHPDRAASLLMSSGTEPPPGVKRTGS